MAYLGQRLLVRLIRFYRRHCSGRGPLRRLTCTFCASESCSAYALRVAANVATSLPEAVRLIRGRLRRCGQASLYCLPDGFGWGESFDDNDLEANMLQAHELPGTVALVLRSAALVARQRGQYLLAEDYVRRAQHYQKRSCPVVVRDGRNWQQCLRRRLWLHWGLAAVMAVVTSVLALPTILTAVGLVGLLVCCARWWRHYLCRCRRFQMQTAAAAFRVSGQVAGVTP